MTKFSFLEESTVLILDDQSTGRTILSRVVSGISDNIKVHESRSPIDALVWASQNEADLVLVDYLMPEMNGIDFIRQLRTLHAYEHVPAIMITIKQDMDTRYSALNAGVTDFLTKPVDMHECLARCRNLLTLRHQQLVLQDKSKTLEKMIAQATDEVHSREKETLIRLARAGEYRDFDTARHLSRMSQYSKLIAKTIGLSKEDVELVELASPLHDIGKIGTPDSILLKRGALTDEEIVIMRQHPIIGHDILQASPSKYLQMGSEIALAHHEKFNGQGYPYGVSGEDIPLSARIVSVADVFDALTTVRPYKLAWTIDAAFEYMVKESGKHFDPEILKAFLSERTAIESIYSDNVESHLPT